jgi:cell division septation protein DedD
MVNDGAIRNFEQLQEVDSERRTPKLVTIAFIALGGACIAFAVLALGGRKSQPAATKVDPLGDLVTQRNHAAAAASAMKPTDLSPRDVTFPGILSDGEKPTTALAAVRTPGAIPSMPGVSPPPATDKLPVVPLPAQALLEATPIVTRPRDGLTAAASTAAQLATPQAPAAPAGKEGGYQLQVSSFRTQGEAGRFADQLRARGHKAYVLEAHVPGRGTWYRVRIGPFPSQIQAANYRSSFEAREHVVPFIVPPATTTTVAPAAPKSPAPAE